VIAYELVHDAAERAADRLREQNKREYKRQNTAWSLRGLGEAMASPPINKRYGEIFASRTFIDDIHRTHLAVKR